MMCIIQVIVTLYSMPVQVHRAKEAGQILVHILKLASLWVITVSSTETSAEVICPTQPETKHGPQSQGPQPDGDYLKMHVAK